MPTVEQSILDERHQARMAEDRPIVPEISVTGCAASASYRVTWTLIGNSHQISDQPVLPDFLLHFLCGYPLLVPLGSFAGK
jgi:hypothetical protein